MKTGKIKRLHATVLALALLCTMLGGVFLSGCGSQDGENGKAHMNWLWKTAIPALKLSGWQA